MSPPPKIGHLGRAASPATSPPGITAPQCLRRPLLRFEKLLFGISIEGMQIKSEEREIQDIESGWAFKVLSLVIAGPISFVLLARSLRNR
jgi:hypothetical protein